MRDINQHSVGDHTILSQRGAAEQAGMSKPGDDVSPASGLTHRAIPFFFVDASGIIPAE